MSAKVIEDLNNKTDFESAVKLRRKLDEDRELVTDLRFEKIRPIEILRIIQSKGPLSQPRIANETSYRLGAVRKHLNDLSGQGKHTTGPNWTDPPIVNQTNSGWELTQYGKLLLEYLENPESTAEKLHKFSIPDQSLEDMLAVDELPDDQKRRIGNILSEINFEPD